MDAIHKLPFMLGGFMAVFIGIISYISGLNSQTIYIRMAVVMVVFYIIGSLIRKTLNTIQDEIKIKLEKESEEEQNGDEFNKDEAPENIPHMAQPGEHRLNLIAGDSEEEFSPLTVNRIITSKMKE